MKKQGVSGVKIAMVYIGTVVGAGFATGQEILQFFVRFGIGGLWGILLSTVLFVLYGVFIMQLGMRFAAQSHLDILQGIGKAGSVVIDALIMISLFGALTAMLAGSGALFAEQFGLPATLGSAIMGVLTAMTVLRGLKGVIDAISAVVPFLIVSVIGISVFTLLNPPTEAPVAIVTTQGGLFGNWLWAAILYASYNILMSAAVLAPLGAVADDRRAVYRGGALGGIGLGAASLLIYLALSASSAETRGLEVPLLHLARQIAPLAGALFSVVLLAEIYTTAVGGLYGFSARLAGRLGLQMSSKIIGATILAFLASLLGFSNLVRTLYPLQGYGGILFLLAILYLRFRQTRSAPR